MTSKTLAEKQSDYLAEARWCKIHGRMEPCPVCVEIDRYEKRYATLVQELSEARGAAKSAYQRGYRAAMKRMGVED